jgi:hypothetical protein
MDPVRVLHALQMRHKSESQGPTLDLSSENKKTSNADSEQKAAMELARGWLELDQVFFLQV